MKLHKKHVSVVTVDFDLCDAGGVIYHPNYLVLLDRARARAMECAQFSHHSLWKMGQALAVVDVSMKYLRPAYYGDQVVIISHVKEVKGSRIFVKQEIYQAADLEMSKSHDQKFIDEASFAVKNKPIFMAEITLVSVKFNPMKAVAPCKELTTMFSE